MLPNPQSPPAPTSEIPHPTSPPPTHWLFAPTIPLPPLPDSFQDPAAHDRLLSDYLDWTGNYVQLAQKHGLDFDTFDRWLHSDIIQSRIKRTDAMSDLRAKTLAKQHRAVAITRLVEIVEDTRSSPVRDRVRAASQILKAADKADTRELREAKAAAHRALTQIATTKTDDEPSTLSLVQEPLPEGGAGVGSVPHPTTEAGRSRANVPTFAFTPPILVGSPTCGTSGTPSHLIRRAQISPGESRSERAADAVCSAIARDGDATFVSPEGEGVKTLRAA